MKRVVHDPTYYWNERGFDAYRDINPTRLKLIAAIAIEFTAVEAQVDSLLRMLLKLDWDETDVASRINGFDGKVAIIKNVTQHSATLKGIPAQLIASALGEAANLKTFRDAVIHANPHNASATMARTSIKHGKPYEVDISVRTLRVLLKRIVALQLELIAVYSLASHHFTDWDLEDHDYSSASKITDGRYFRRHLRQLQRRHDKRKSLPLIPKLKEESASEAARRRGPLSQHDEPEPES